MCRSRVGEIRRVQSPEGTSESHTRTSAVPCGTGRLFNRQPRTASWATFTRPLRDWVICKSMQQKRSLGCAHRFRLTYALANVGHTRRFPLMLLRRGLRRDLLGRAKFSREGPIIFWLVWARLKSRPDTTPTTVHVGIPTKQADQLKRSFILPSRLREVGLFSICMVSPS